MNLAIILLPIRLGNVYNMPFRIKGKGYNQDISWRRKMLIETIGLKS